MKRPDFSGVIKIAKHYDGKSDKTKRKHAEFLREAKEESLTANKTPYDVFKENLEIDRANRKKKLVEATTTSANSMKIDEGNQDDNIHDAWLLVDERNSLNCRDNFICELDIFCDLCLTVYSELQDEMKKILWGYFQTYNSKRSPTFDDFSLLVFQADPRISEATVADMLEFALDETKSFNSGSSDDTTTNGETEHVNLQSFLKAAAKYGFFACDCRTFGTRVGTGLEAEKARLQYDKFLSNVKLLDSLDLRQRYKIAGALNKVTYKKGSKIIKQGNKGMEFYLILRGKVGVEKEEADGSRKFLLNLNVGDYFGEQALLSNEPRNATCIANSDVVVCLTLRRSAFDELLGPLEHLMKKNLAEFDSILKDWNCIEAAFNDYVENVRKEMRSSTVKRLKLGVRLKQLVDARDNLLSYIHDRADANAARRAYHRLLQMHPDPDQLINENMAEDEGASAET